jgi:hypothetical protein
METQLICENDNIVKNQQSCYSKQREQKIERYSRPCEKSGCFDKRKDYEARLVDKDFEIIQKILNNPAKVVEMSMFESGVNPKTNRKIKKGSKTHKTIIDDYTFNSAGRTYTRPYYLSEIREIYNNKKHYDQETQRLKQLYDSEEERCFEYNEKVREARQKIDKLQKWEETVEFEGVYYGMPERKDNIHYRDNCLGEFECTGYEVIEGNCRPFMIMPDTYRYHYRCKKCGYEY